MCCTGRGSRGMPLADAIRKVVMVSRKGWCLRASVPSRFARAPHVRLAPCPKSALALLGGRPLLTTTNLLFGLWRAFHLGLAP
jgi:hypothetical protein